MGDRVGVIGGGGREDTLVKKYVEDKNIELIAAFPGNGLMDYDPKAKNFKNERVLCFPDLGVDNFDGILKKAKELGINHMNVAQDDPLSWGYVDRFEEAGIPAFGPRKDAAILEWDKGWARPFMRRHGIPHPQFWVCTTEREGFELLEKLPDQEYYVKKRDLTGGKGSLYARNKEEARQRIKEMDKFGKPGYGYLIEDCMKGEEVSMYVLVDSKGHCYIMRSTQDNKRRYNFDGGPQTGGMGAHCPARIIEENPDLVGRIDQSIVQPTIHGMIKEERPYSGVLYLALMIEEGLVPNTCEYNSRHGDPEIEPLLPGLITPSLLAIERACMEGNLDKLKIVEDDKKRVDIVGAAREYPVGKVKDKRIYGLEEAIEMDGIKIYGGGIVRDGNRLYAQGGRIFHVVAEGDSYREMIEKALHAMSKIFIEDNELDYRHDIAWRDLQRELKEIYM